MRVPAAPAFSRFAVDALVALLLVVGAAFATWQANKLVDPVIYEGDTINVWFDADVPRVIENETSRGSDHYRTKVHPLYSLMTFPPVRILIVAARPVPDRGGEGIPFGPGRALARDPLRPAQIDGLPLVRSGDIRAGWGDPDR